MAALAAPLGELSADVSSHGEVTTSVDQFHADGYLPVPQVASAALLARCRDAAMEAREECFAEIVQRGDPSPLPVGTKHGYRELVQRQIGRYEMRHGLSDGPLGELRRVVESSPAYAIAAAALEEHVVIGVSCVIADEDCAAQTWHVDGGHVSTSAHERVHCTNIFVPLVDLTLGGGTEFRPGSHYITRDLKRMMFLAKIKKTLRPTIVPDLRLGDAVLFDYRVLHRGTRNTSGGPRPVFVMTLAKPWFRDLLNFPRRALFPGEHLAEDDLTKAAQDDPSDSDPTPAAT